MAKVRVVGTLKQPGRCAYCHDDLAALGHKCEPCGTWVHLDCWREAGACPSPGCDEPAPQAPKSRSKRRRERRSRGRTPSRRPRTPAGRAHASEDADLLAWAQERATQPRAHDLSARLAPYFRLLLSLVGHVAILILLCVIAVWFLIYRQEVTAAFRETKDATDALWGVVVFLGLLGIGGGVGIWSSVWLLQWPSVWTETGRLLRAGTPTPMRLRVWSEGHGKQRKTLASFRRVGRGMRGNPLDRVEVGGLLWPHWLATPCTRKPVLVYGIEDATPPFLIEDSSGKLALLYP